jgi:hypothetical protein
VPDDLLGKEVKCPGCSAIFTAEVGAAPAPPKPQKKADDEGGTYEVLDERKKKRRRSDDDDEDQNERVSDKPRPRRARDDDDYDDEDDERVTTRRRRFSRDDDDDDDEDAHGPPKAALAPDWTRIRLGFSLLLASVLTLIGAVLIGMVGGCCVGFGAAANAAKQGPGQPPDVTKMAAGFVVIAVVTMVIRLAAHLMMIVGSVMCLPSPSAYRAKTLALVTLILAGGSVALQLIQQVVNVAANGVAGLGGGAGNPFLGGAGAAPPGAAAAIVLVVLGLVGFVVGLASYFTFGLYVRSIGFCLRDDSLAGSAKGWLVALTITVIVGLIATVAAFALAGAALWAMAQGRQPGPGGQPGAALGGGMIAVGGLACLIGIGFLALLIWYIVLLVQARGAISTRTSRQRY